jgi:hypothetical protein
MVERYLPLWLSTTSSCAPAAGNGPGAARCCAAKATARSICHDTLTAPTVCRPEDESVDAESDLLIGVSGSRPLAVRSSCALRSFEGQRNRVWPWHETRSIYVQRNPTLTVFICIFSGFAGDGYDGDAAVTRATAMLAQCVRDQHGKPAAEEIMGAIMAEQSAFITACRVRSSNHASDEIRDARVVARISG